MRGTKAVERDRKRKEEGIEEGKNEKGRGRKGSRGRKDGLRLKDVHLNNEQGESFK